MVRFFAEAFLFWNAFFAFLILSVHLFWLRVNYMHHFWAAYFIHLVPFAIINGILTATPVVLYNNDENLGIRLGTIPLEDTLYAFTCLLLPLTIMQALRDGFRVGPKSS